MVTGTSTSEFGSNGWVAHDSSGYYSRDLIPLWQKPRSEVNSEESAPTLEVRHRFFHKSSENMRELEDSSVHLMITSPPYNVGKTYDTQLTVAEHIALIKQVLGETYRVLVPGGRACVNIANIGRKPYIPLHAYLIQAAAELGFEMRGEIVWHKGMNGSSTAWGSWKSPANPTLRDTHEYILVFQKPPFGRKRLPGREATIESSEFLEWTKSVWQFPPASAKRLRHPAPFPVELPRRLISLYSFSNEVVLDPFMGTGSSAVAALRSGRRFIGYDTEGRYIKVANERLEEEGLIDIYEQIATRNYDGIADGLDDHSLTGYFDACFNDAIREFRLYPAWACMTCMLEGKTTADLGEKPSFCRVCKSDMVYQIATFQVRAMKTGAMFRRAVDVLFRRRFNLDLRGVRWKSSMDIATDSPPLAIGVHGSPDQIVMPDNRIIELAQPGMARQDTLKKARDDARSYKQYHPWGEFFVLTNSPPVPTALIANDGVDQYVDVTKFEEISGAAKKFKDLMRQ